MWALSDSAMTATINGMAVSAPVTLFGGKVNIPMLHNEDGEKPVEKKTEKKHEKKETKHENKSKFSKDNVVTFTKKVTELFRSKEYAAKLNLIHRPEDLQPCVDEGMETVMTKMSISASDKHEFKAYLESFKSDPEIQTLAADWVEILQPHLNRVMDEALTSESQKIEAVK